MPDIVAGGIAIPITLMTFASMRGSSRRVPASQKQSLVLTALLFILLGYALAGSAHRGYPLLTVVLTCGMLIGAGVYDLYEVRAAVRSSPRNDSSTIAILFTSLALTGDGFVTGAFLGSFGLPFAKTLGILLVSCFGVWLALRACDADRHLTQRHLRRIGAAAFVVSGIVFLLGTLTTEQR